MIYDTDILIWIQKGNEKAAKLIEKDDDKYLSIQSYMELLGYQLNTGQIAYSFQYNHEEHEVLSPRASCFLQWFKKCFVR